MEQIPGQYLFVFTKSLNTASARYLLRHGAVLARTGNELTMLLMGDAAKETTMGRATSVGCARLCVLGCVGEPWVEMQACLERVCEADLASMMLAPRVQTTWC